MTAIEAVIVVCLLIVAHFTQRTMQEIKKTNAKLDRMTENMENFMRGAETYMSARLKKD